MKLIILLLAFAVMSTSVTAEAKGKSKKEALTHCQKLQKQLKTVKSGNNRNKLVERLWSECGL